MPAPPLIYYDKIPLTTLPNNLTAMSKPVILLIDDDKTMLNSLMDQLRDSFRKEYTIEAVQTIAEARDLLQMLNEQQVPVRLVISDWLMPPDRTNELLEEIHAEYPDITLMMLSGYADEAAVERARQKANLFSFVRKPWEETELITEVRRAIA